MNKICEIDPLPVTVLDEKCDNLPILVRTTSHIVEELKKGNVNPSLGSKYAFGDIFEMRTANYIRTYYRIHLGYLEIIKQATAENRQEILAFLKKTYHGRKMEDRNRVYELIQGYKLFLYGYVNNPLDDNLDFEIISETGHKYYGTFFTLNNINSLMRRYTYTGENFNGKYFWAVGSLIIKDFSIETILGVTNHLIESNELSPFELR